MVDWLAELITRYPAVANVPVIAVLLLLGAVFYYAAFGSTIYFRTRRYALFLAICYKVGYGMLVGLCLVGCIYFASVRTVARRKVPVNTFLRMVDISAALVVVPSLFRDLTPERRNKNRRG